MKTHKKDSMMATRNHYLEKIYKRENSIATNRTNFLDFSVNKIAEGFNQNRKMNYVRINVEKQNKVFIFIKLGIGKRQK